MTAKPEISVLMPVYNAEKSVKSAIWSILNQSFSNFELLIYLDGCTDNTESMVNSISDSRIRVIGSDLNRGIVFARNQLIAESVGRFIAWQDADDISLPGRLAYQFDFIDVHPEIVIIGSWVSVRNNRKVSGVAWPEDNEILKSWAFYRNPMIQSSLMIRKKKDFPVYESEFEYMEDYRLISQLRADEKIYVYPAILSSYYEDSEENRISKYLKYDFVSKLEKIMLSNFQKLNLKPSKNELSLIREFLRGNKSVKNEEALILLNFFKLAIKRNREYRVYNIWAFNSVSILQIVRILKVNKSAIVKVLFYLIRNFRYIPGVISVRTKYKK